MIAGRSGGVSIEDTASFPEACPSVATKSPANSAGTDLGGAMAAETGSRLMRRAFSSRAAEEWISAM